MTRTFSFGWSEAYCAAAWKRTVVLPVPPLVPAKTWERSGEGRSPGAGVAKSAPVASRAPRAGVVAAPCIASGDWWRGSARAGDVIGFWSLARNRRLGTLRATLETGEA
jgi:hypothetical protein